MNTLETFDTGFDRMQERFSGAITIIPASSVVDKISPTDIKNGADSLGFLDISMPARELTPLLGRVVLSLDRKHDRYCPAVVTKKDNKLQMSRLNQAYDPLIGLTDGIRFSLGLKNDTSQPAFGSHVAAGGFEAGHFAPVLVAVRSEAIRSSIKSNGDSATHAVGSDVGGVPEKMIQSNLLPGINLVTTPLDVDNPHSIPLFWHHTLESDDGLTVAQYEGSVKLMLGAAANALGERAVDTVGGLVNDAVRGY